MLNEDYKDLLHVLSDEKIDGQFSRPKLDEDLPQSRYTEQQTIFVVQKHAPRRFGKSRVFGDNPEKHVRIQQDIHQR